MPGIIGRKGARSAIFIVAVWAVIAVVAALVVNHPSTSKPAVGGGPGPVSGGPGPVNWARPLVDAQTTTIAGAESAVGYTIPIPITAAASRANLVHVWTSPNKQVALVFDRGRITLIIGPATYRDPASWFRTIVAESPGKAALGRVNGKPAVVIQPNSDPYGANPAWVEFYRNGLDINVVSARYGTATLLSIANSLR